MNKDYDKVMKKFLYKLIQKLKIIVEVFYPGYYSENCNSIKRIIKNKNLSIENIYDIGCYKGEWYKERRRTFPSQSKYFLFDAQTLLDSKIKNKNLKFFNVVLGSKQGQIVQFWQDGGSGSSFFKELGNNLWDEVTPKEYRVSTLEHIIKQQNLPLPNYLKIDTQGTEIEVLKGLNDLMNIDDLYFVELEISLYRINEKSPLINDVIKFLEDQNYLLISVEQLPIVEYFNERKLVQLNGIFARKDLISN